MRLSPDLALLRWAAVWLGAAVLSVPWVALRPAVPIAGLLLLAALIADALLARGEKEIGLERIAPEDGARDARLPIEIVVRNPLTRAVRLELRESLPRDLLESEPAWSKLRVEPGSVRRLRYAIRPRVRGQRVWGPLVAQVRSPLGLLRRRVMAGEGRAIRVRPETERFLRPEALDPRRVLAALGARPRRRRGDGLELDSLREYVIGDEPRRIDWRASARRGRPIVRTHRHEESRTLLLAVDASRLMGSRAPAARAGSHADSAAVEEVGSGRRLPNRSPGQAWPPPSSTTPSTRPWPWPLPGWWRGIASGCWFSIGHCGRRSRQSPIGPISASSSRRWRPCSRARSRPTIDG